MCVACNGYFDRSELIKVTLVQDEQKKEFRINDVQKYNGRSFYLYPSKECLESFLRNRKKVIRRFDPKAIYNLTAILTSLEKLVCEQAKCPGLASKEEI